MATTAVSATPQQYFGTPAKKTSELNMTTFIRLLTVQLANQNPLEPMSDRDFFAQLAQLGQVQGTDKMTSQLETMQASSLIGKTVRATITRAEGAPSEETFGRVMGMDVKNGEQILKVQEADGGLVDVKFENILSITDIQIQYPPIPTLADASALMGRTVKAWQGDSATGSLIEGQIVRASLKDGIPMVTLNMPDGTSMEVRYDSIREVVS